MNMKTKLEKELISKCKQIVSGPLGPQTFNDVKKTLVSTSQEVYGAETKPTIKKGTLSFNSSTNVLKATLMMPVDVVVDFTQVESDDLSTESAEQ